jgi:hypothetical protein
LSSFDKKKKKKEKKKERKKEEFKNIIGILGLENLFFTLHTFIRSTYGTCCLEKDEIYTSISFFVHKLTVGYMLTL